MQLYLNPRRIEDYRRFLAIKALPTHRFRGRMAEFPDEYAESLGMSRQQSADMDYQPAGCLFDYQRDIARLAIRRRKFAVFAECGLGKTLVLLEWARHVSQSLPPDACTLILSPLNVIEQTIGEAEQFYGGSLPIERIPSSDLAEWLKKGSGIGVANFEALKKGIRRGRLAALGVDEASIMKSAYGQFGQRIIDLGKGIDWKLSLTGTPAPNDRIEYANQAVFLDQVPTVNAFLAKYFVNRGQTANRWELRPHALGPFYRSLSHWCIFLTNPGVYGWKDNCQTVPPIEVHIESVDLTPEQRKLAGLKTGQLVTTSPGGITGRGWLSMLAKGWIKDGKKIVPIPTLKYDHIHRQVTSWRDSESTLIWCLYDEEQRRLEETFPDAASISGKTKYDERIRLINDFKAERRRIMISKPKILGFGLNLQVATRQVFSGLKDSYELYWQAAKRSNRIGSTRPLSIHIPVTEIEEAMVETVMAKAARIDEDTQTQEQIFLKYGYIEGIRNE